MRIGDVKYIHLSELLNYNPLTGIFKWKSIKNRTVKGGKPAGSLGKDGYIVIMADRKKYYAHRLAWLFVHGCFPKCGLDHKNRIKDDNRIANLREASSSLNTRNTGKSKRNTSGIVGVCWSKIRNKWIAHIKINNKAFNLGGYSNFWDAVEARLSKEIELDWENTNHIRNEL